MKVYIIKSEQIQTETQEKLNTSLYTFISKKEIEMFKGELAEKEKQLNNEIEYVLSEQTIDI